MPLVLCLPIKPRSLNAKPKLAYSSSISTEARNRHNGELFSGPLYSRIIWFHKYHTKQGDIDNIAKRIHDALKNVVFADDNTITHTIAIRIDATSEVEIVSDPDNPDAAAELQERLSTQSVQDVLYIEIGRQTDRQILLGPVS